MISPEDSNVSWFWNACGKAGRWVSSSSLPGLAQAQGSIQFPASASVHPERQQVQNQKHLQVLKTVYLQQLLQSYGQYQHQLHLQFWGKSWHLRRSCRRLGAHTGPSPLQGGPALESSSAPFPELYIQPHPDQNFPFLPLLLFAVRFYKILFLHFI